ncbi:hypothetical protein QSH57_004859 [Fusarium oxysporum f. sp. vasinfectum]|nr:hypothetical protein QSH57_004859 [Fusarium oxysporum f. sp. vasinfectum]
MAKTDDNHENDSIYLVDSIQDHFVDEDGCMYFQVKWQGHESSKEWTWEPQTNLESVACFVPLRSAELTLEIRRQNRRRHVGERIFRKPRQETEESPKVCEEATKFIRRYV